MIYDLIKKNRSYRRFDESYEIERDTLVKLVDLARLSPSGSNLQPLRYYLSNDKEENDKIFSCLGWARRLKDWHGPPEGERPSAYIVILGDQRVSQSFNYDPGIAAHSILLGATEMGLGGCMFGNIAREKLQDLLKLDEHYEILLIAAIGKPVEKVVLDTVNQDGNTDYWRDEQAVHHVPKRKLEDLIL